MDAHVDDRSRIASNGRSVEHQHGAHRHGSHPSNRLRMSSGCLGPHLPRIGEGGKGKGRPNPGRPLLSIGRRVPFPMGRWTGLIRKYKGMGRMGGFPPRVSYDEPRPGRSSDLQKSRFSFDARRGFRRQVGGGPSRGAFRRWRILPP